MEEMEDRARKMSGFPFISTMYEGCMMSIHQYDHNVSRVMWLGKHPFLACWNTSTSNPSKQQPLCWQLVSSTKSAAAFRSAASSLCRDQLQLVATRYDCFFPTIQISWWPMTGSICYGTHLHQQPPLLFIFKGGAQLHLRLANWANCIWVLVDGEWMANIYFL